jgi:zinc D-Ala-D-Ala carboxypeptidase
MKGKQISKNFWSGEFGIDSQTPAIVVRNVENLVFGLLQPLRDTIESPVMIGSGYRTKEQNDKVGGVSDSQHLTGQAADIKTRLSPPDLFDLIRTKFVFDVLILYPKGYKNYPNGGVHVSFVRGLNRNITIVK